MVENRLHGVSCFYAIFQLSVIFLCYVGECEIIHDMEIRESDRGVILAGQRTKRATQVHVAILSSGQIFGELAARNATARGTRVSPSVSQRHGVS